MTEDDSRKNFDIWHISSVKKMHEPHVTVKREFFFAKWPYRHQGEIEKIVEEAVKRPR